MNVLIIDDDFQNRKCYYEKIFDGFTITGIDQKSQVGTIKYKNYKLIAIDLFLWNDSPHEAKSIMDNLDGDIPIVLISQKWTSGNGGPLEQISSIRHNKTIIKIIAFQRLTCASENDVDKICQEYNSEIIISYNAFYNHNSVPIKDDATINILHISDMQFGGNVSEAAYFDVDTICEFLKQNFYMPHIVMISGDIAQSGNHSEYSKALEWFETLKKGLFKDENQKNRFIVSPGNHDANFNYFAAFLLNYDFKTSRYLVDKDSVDDTNKNSLRYKKSDISKDIIDSVVFNNFARFAYELTEDERWLLNSNHYNLVINNFENLGIRIIVMNSNANITALDSVNGDPLKSHRGAGIDVSACSKLKENLNEEKLFTITLSHLGPYEMGINSENTLIWSQTRNFLDSIKNDLWLCGHAHQLRSSKIDEDDARYISQKPFAYSGSLRLNPSSLPQDAHRGFNVIQLHRKEGIVEQIDIIQCEIVMNNIRVKSTKEYIN